MKAWFDIFLKSRWMMSVALLVAVFCFYPLQVFLPPYSGAGRAAWRVLTPASISCLALALCAFNMRNLLGVFHRHRLPVLASAAIGFTVVIHVLGRSFFSSEIFFPAMFCLSLPLAGFCLAKDLRRAVAWALALLWLVNLGQLIFTFSFGGWNHRLFGLPGNTNWHGCFLLYTTPLAIYSVNSWLRHQAWSFRQRMVIGLVMAGISVVLLYRCHSRGAWLAFAATSVVYIYFLLPPASWWRRGALASAALLLAASMAVMMVYGSGLIKNFERQESRIPLWRGAMRMAVSMPVNGVGIDRFEEVFAVHRGAGYFLNRHTSPRSRHPHNHYLYFLLCNGWPAFIAWLFLTITPIIAYLRRFDRLAWLDRWLFLAFLMILFHAQFDLVLFEWPANVFGMIILGLMWRRTWPAPKLGGTARDSRVFRLTFNGVGAILIIIALMMAGREAWASYHEREAGKAMLRKDDERQFAELSRSVEIKPNPLIYEQLARICLLKRKNPGLALEYLNKLSETPMGVVGHSEGFKGKILLDSGLYQEALPHFQEEVRRFPLLVGGWYQLGQCQHRLGMSREAAETHAIIQQIMKLRGLPMNYFKVLISNPQYDLRPDKIPAESRRELGN